jgi:DNA-binding HxlR family transcriptional regulator
VCTYHPEVPPRVEYEISELGRSLAPIFAHLADWSAENLRKVERARREYDEADLPAGVAR